MSVNRYTNLQFQGPVSSHVPLPLDFIYKAGLNKQKQFDDAVDESYKLNDLMTKVNAIDQHKSYKKDLENEFYPKIEDIASRIVEKGDLSAARDLRRVAREWQHSPLRQELEKSYADYNLDLKDVTELKQKGNYTDVYDPFNNYQGSNQEGAINPYRRKGVRPSQDYLKIGQELMKDIAKSGAESGSYKIDAGGNVIGLKSGWEAVYQADVDRVAQNSLTPFLKSKEGEYFVDEIKYNQPKAESNDIAEGAYNYLRGLGNKQVFKDKKFDTDFKYSPWAKDDHDKIAANETTSTQSESLNSNALIDPTKDIEFDSNGNVKVSKDAGSYQSVKGGHDEFGIYDKDKVQWKTGTGALDISKTNKDLAIITQIKKEHPELLKLSPKEAVDAYRKAAKSIHSESIPLESISNVAAKNIGEAIARNGIQRNIYLHDSHGKTEDGTKETVLKELGIDEEDLLKQIKDNGIGGFTQAGPSAGAYYVDVKGDNGKHRRVIISADNEMQNMFKTSQVVNTARKKLQHTIETPFSDMPNYQIEVKPSISKDGNVKWEYNEIVTDPNSGKQIKNPTTLQDIREAEKKHLKESNYLGSQIGVLKDNTTE